MVTLISMLSKLSIPTGGNSSAVTLISMLSTLSIPTGVNGDLNFVLHTKYTYWGKKLNGD